MIDTRNFILISWRFSSWKLLNANRFKLESKTKFAEIGCFFSKFLAFSCKKEGKSERTQQILNDLNKTQSRSYRDQAEQGTPTASFKLFYELRNKEDVEKGSVQIREDIYAHDEWREWREEEHERKLGNYNDSSTSGSDSESTRKRHKNCLLIWTGASRNGCWKQERWLVLGQQLTVI